MEIAVDNDVLIENYLGLLNSLSRESKVKVVKSLSSDINNYDISENEWIDRLYGSFISDVSAEMMVSKIRAGRQFNREVAGFIIE